MKEKLCSNTVHLLSKIKLEDLMRPDIYRKASEKQPPEDKPWLVVIRKKGQHPVHQMGRLLVPRERKGNQSFKTLIIVQRVERYKTILENTIWISSRRGVDKVQDLRRHLSRKNCYCVVELGFADRNIAVRKLSVHQCKPNFGRIQPENRQLHRHIGYR